MGGGNDGRTPELSFTSERVVESSRSDSRSLMEIALRNRISEDSVTCQNINKVRGEVAMEEVFSEGQKDDGSGLADQSISWVPCTQLNNSVLQLVLGGGGG